MLKEYCPSCGGRMPIDGHGGYQCEVFLCSACEALVCQDCARYPAEFLGIDAPLYFRNYFNSLGYKDPMVDDAYTMSFCDRCLTAVEASYIKLLPASKLLEYVNNEWLYDVSEKLFRQRLQTEV